MPDQISVDDMKVHFSIMHLANSENNDPILNTLVQ